LRRSGNVPLVCEKIGLSVERMVRLNDGGPEIKLFA
jgi:hypothetical protein